QDYHQTFSAVAADRQTERLTVDQRVRSGAVGASAQWFALSRGANVVVAGADGRRVSGNDYEGSAVVSGEQRTGAAYVEDVLTAPRMTMTAAMRVARWRDETAWSPRASLLYRANDRIAFTASAYRAFRAPTLNELIRNFRQGNVLTLANRELGPERLSAVEA